MSTNEEWNRLARAHAAGEAPDIDALLALFQQSHGNLSAAAEAAATVLLDTLNAGGDPERFAYAVWVVGLRWSSYGPLELIGLLRRGLQAARNPRLQDGLRLQLANVHSLAGNHAEAARLLDAVTSEDLPDWDAHVYALQLERLGRLADAEVAWRALIARPRAPDRVRALAWSCIGHTRMCLGRMDEAKAALDEADAIKGAGADVELHVDTMRFEHAIRRRDLAAARAILDAAVTDDPIHAMVMGANRTCVDALDGTWDAQAFSVLMTNDRADLRLMAATGLMGAAAIDGDPATAREALLTAERAYAAAPVFTAELAWLAEGAATAWEHLNLPASDVARARRWAARAARWDPDRATVQHHHLTSLGIPLAGPFQLGAVLGRGGGGTVFYGLHVCGLSAAVKVLHDVSEGKRDLLENELRAVAALDHPCIASLFDTGIVDDAEAATHPDLTAGTRWVASELVGGGELLTLCGTIPWKRCLSLILGILDALAHAHARDLLHLDIKPTNVLLHPSGAPVLVDFGLARGIGSGQPDQLSGTPEFMAPELFEAGWDQVGPSTDLFAAACTLYQLLAVEPPFMGSIREVRRQHLSGAPPLPKRTPVPPGLDRWFRTALAPRPADRFPTAASAAQALLGLGPPGGSAQGAGAAPPVPVGPPSEAPTVVLGGLLATSLPVSLAAPEMPIPQPRLPRSWTRTERRLRPEIATASLGLFRHRRPPLVGRRAERSLLWSSLVEAERGQRVVVAITGPARSGRRALVRWLVERAREVGVVRPQGSLTMAHLHQPELDAVRGANAPMVIVTADAWHDDWPDAVEIFLRPMADDAIREVLAGGLRLADDLAAQIVAHARGLPGIAVDILEDLVSMDNVVDGPDGYRLRPGAALSPHR